MTNMETRQNKFPKEKKKKPSRRHYLFIVDTIWPRKETSELSRIERKNFLIPISDIPQYMMNIIEIYGTNLSVGYAIKESQDNKILDFYEDVIPSYIQEEKTFHDPYPILEKIVKISVEK